MTPEFLVSAVAAIGFGIQQFLQVLVDPIASIVITAIKERGADAANGGATGALPYGISDVDAKKAILGIVSFVLGLLLTGAAPALRVLKVAGLADMGAWDFFITALTISAGTEGVNSVVKLVQYVKDAVKAKTPPSVAQNSPVPQAPSADIGTEAFLANVGGLGLAEVALVNRDVDTMSRAKEDDYDAQ